MSPESRTAMTSLSRRRLLATGLAAGGLALTGLAAPALAQQANANAQLLARVETYLNGITTLRARFLQIAQNGASAEGTAFIARPGRMRFDYDPPEPLLLVASDGQFLYYDRELRQPSIVPVGSTPLGFLLRERIRFADVQVLNVERARGLVGITVNRRDNPGEGRLTLILNEEPMELRQWLVVDAQGHQTRVTLSTLEPGVELPRRLFTFNDPRFFDEYAAPAGAPPRR